MMDAEARVALVVRGVVRQALQDAGVDAWQRIGAPSAASRLIEEWCELPVRADAAALSFSALNKTELLLAGVTEQADLYPLGDLYASEVAGFAEIALSPAVAALAEQAGGIAALDAVLRALLDERRTADAAFAGVPHLHEVVLARLRETAFRRARIGIIPKLGARTIGIDLFI